MTMAALAIYYAYLGVVSAASWRLAPGQAGSLVISITGMVSHA